MNIFTDIFSNFIMVISLLYVWHKLLNKKIDYKDFKLYVTLIVIMIISIFTYLLVNDFIRIFIITIIFMIFFRFLFRERIQKCIITPIYYQLMVMLSEALFASIVVMLKIDLEITMTSPIVNMISNILIASILVFVVNIKYIVILYNKILKITDKIRTTHLMVLCFIVIIFLNLFIMSAYYKIDFKYWFVFNISLILVCFIIVLYSFRTQNKYNKVSDKYNIAIKSLNDYEDMMTKYRIANHENKNLLLTVRAMILNKEKDIPKYIDSIVENKYDDDEKLFFKINVIPSGGLRATIYSEILKLQNNKIDYNLDIDSNLKTIDLLEIDTSTTIDICKIIGVFTDNSIEAVKPLKNKNVNISIYLEKNSLVIKISNNYKGKIDVNKIFMEGYSTKGNERGYGLALVKKIISGNSKFSNKIEVNNDIFSQLLFIKYR